MHACSLARRLRIPTVLVPKNAGVLSALGMLLSDTIKDYSRSILRPAASISGRELSREFRPLLEQARRDLGREGFQGPRMRLQRFLDVRYIGQSYELTVPFIPSYRKEFDRLHQRKYGYADEERPVEVVNLRVKAIGLTDKPPLPDIESGGRDARAARIDRRPMRFENRDYRADVYVREFLRAGNMLSGPALVLDYESTAVVPPDFAGRVDKHGNLIISSGRARR